MSREVEGLRLRNTKDSKQLFFFLKPEGPYPEEKRLIWTA